MTVNGQTICNIIQAFPALLILVQKTDKCLHTPLIYKPPTPTHPPEYYEAYDNLLHLLLHDSCHDFQYGVPQGYSKKYPYELGHKKLCYNFQYPNSVAGHYPYYGGFSYGSNHSPHHGYEVHYPSYDSHSYYDSKSYKGYNGTYVYKTNYVPTTYAPVHRRKYKVVVKNVGRKVSQKLTAIGFFPQREERTIPSPFNFFTNTNRFRNSLNNLFNLGRQTPNQYDQNRPVNNNQFGSNGPFNNNQYPNRPIYNNEYGSNTPINNNQYDTNGQLYNNQFDQNRPNNNQFNQYGADYPYNQQNNVRFPNRGSDIIEVIEVPYEDIFEVPKPTNSPIPAEPTPEYVEQPNNVPNEETNAETNYPSENSVNFNSEPTSSPFGNGQDSESDEPFGNKNGIPTVPPPRFSTNRPRQRLTPVPPSESRNNFNFGSAGIFQPTCTTIEGGVGSCIVLPSCEQYVKLLAQAKTNPAAVQVLRKAHCGFEGSNPKVCCPLARIPNTPPPTPRPEVTPPPTSAPVTSVDTAAGKSLSSDFVTEFPSPPECGLSNASFSRVVGGVDAKLGDFPWMALLGYQGRRGADTRWLCGGSLITSHHVLTAAHCIHNHETDLYVVRLGELDLASEDDGAIPIDVLIKYKIKHEGYNPKSFTNDIGLLVLQNNVQFSSLIRPICIPTSKELRAKSFENYTPLIAGWGNTEFRGPSASHLQVLQLPVVSNDFCAKAYSQYKAQVIDERVLCAGFKNGGKDACQGDSGGPLMQPVYNPENLTTYFFQTGVISYGKRCAEAGFPGVYTRVTNFVPWLQQNVLGHD